MKHRTLKPKQFLDEFYPGSGINVKTVLNWMDKGLLPFVATPRGQRLVLIDDYVQMITGNPDYLER